MSASYGHGIPGSASFQAISHPGFLRLPKEKLLRSKGRGKIGVIQALANHFDSPGGPGWR
jgi:hypothetical protein